MRARVVRRFASCIAVIPLLMMKLTAVESALPQLTTTNMSHASLSMLLGLLSVSLELFRTTEIESQHRFPAFAFFIN
jgi:hypothetical protein